MERAARRFAGWVLVIHVLLFLLLVSIVALASREFYLNARTAALEQLRIRQEMLATQAARGVEGFYRGILDDLDLPRRAGAMVPREVAAQLAWEQLRGRATRVFEVEGELLSRVVLDFGEDQTPAAQLVKDAAAMLMSVKSPTVIPVTLRGAVDRMLVVLPVDAQPRRALVAVVPNRAIESRFLNDLNQPRNMSSILFSDEWRILSAEDRSLAGGTMADTDAALLATMLKKENNGARITREVRAIDVGESKLKLDPAMITLQPLDLPGQQRWWLAVSSKLTEVDQAVGRFLRRSIIGAVLVILAMTAVLVSTSVQSIRSRIRLERMKHEMIKRELDAAREIQLAWLPEAQGAKIAVDIAAMNKPASHVSGDFYNWFELPDGRVVIVIGDVTGHGLPAAFLMATTQLLVRTTMESRGDPGAALRQVNRQLCAHVFSGQFVTMLVVALDPTTGVLEIANAGHPPPLIGAGDAFQPLPLKPQLVLAVDETVNYETQRFELPAGASILLYTDGITELRAPSGERLGIDGLANSLFGRFDPATSLVEAASDAVESFRAGREADDDLTLVALQLAPAPAPATEESQPEQAAQGLSVLGFE